MSKTLNVNLVFSSDTRAAQQQITQLQQELSNLAAKPINLNGSQALKQDLQEASNKAIELKIALNNAVNVKTGKLNFGKFSQELKKNKTSLEQYAMSLKKLGPEGVQTFNNLAVAIRQSETPLLQLKGKVADLGTTLMNTAKWQLSSSLIHGLMSAFTGTIGYAKELNESLNNIRIVTGKSVDEMHKFALEANEAAQALSTTTTEYTNAALIYYQQGLSNAEVKERAETTLKLANVVGESAETVSEWMTSIWNNFDNGSQKLEYYADVLTKLGAATASSADEIAGGIEKFSAVADTVGLSYEYAASALATITAETRQSEDVVGTALKTIFARVENLKLGETLEDGTNLGQYSEALMKVGVNIKDSNGQLKDMDNILSEIGNRWGSLNKDSQVALAQSVAGIRQYNQFMALMSNWDVMERNLELTKEASGELEYQQTIYEQGIEGATARVQASLEEIKNSLLDENDLVPLLNFAEGFLNVVGDLVDAFGGLPGILTLVASGLLKIYGPQVASGIQGLVSNLALIGGVLAGNAQKERSDAILKSSTLAADMSADTGTGETGIVQSEILKREADITALIEENEGNISKENLEQLNLLRQLLEVKEKLVMKTAEEHDMAQGNADKARKKLEASGVSNQEIDDLENAAGLNTRAESFEAIDIKEDGSNIGDIRKQADSLVADVQRGSGVDSEQFEIIEKAQSKVKTSTNQYTRACEKLAREEKKLSKITDKSSDAYKTQSKKVADAKEKIQELGKGVKDAQKELTSAIKSTGKYGKTLDDLKKNHSDVADTLEEFGDSTRETVNSSEELKTQQKDLEQAFDDYGDSVHNAANQGVHWTTTLVTGMQSVASAAAGIQMVWGSIDSLSSAMADGTASFSDYLSAITSTFFALPMIITPISQVVGWLGKYKKAQAAVTGEEKKNILVKTAKAIVTKLSKKATQEETKEEEKNIKAKNKGNASILTRIFFNIAEDGSKGPKGWVIAAASAAIVAALIGAAIAVSAGKKEEAQEEETVETNTENLEAIEETQELSGSVKDLTSEYKKLSESGESVTDIIDQMNEKVPELIQNYKDLGEQLGGTTKEDIEGLTEELERLYEVGKITGDFTEFENKQREIDTAIAEEQYDAAITNAKIAGKKGASVMEDAVGGSVDGNTVTLDVGGSGTWGVYDEEEKALTYLEKHMGDYYENSDGWFKSGGKLKLEDAGNANEYIKYYESMKAAVDDMAASMDSDDLNSSDIYRELKEALSAGKEQYEAMLPLAEAQATAATQVVEANLRAEGKYIENIKSLEDYNKYKDEFVKQAKEKGVSEEQALNYLKSNEELKALTNQYELASMAAEKFSGVSNFEELDSENKQKYLKEFEKMTKDLSEDDLVLAINVMANADSIDEFEKEMLKVGAQAEIQRYKNMSEEFSKIMSESQKEKTFSEGQLSTLSGNKEFSAFIGEEKGLESISEFTALTYNEQYAIVAEFYSKIQTLQFDSQQYQKELLYEELADYQEIYDKVIAMDEETQKKMIDTQFKYQENKRKLEEENIGIVEKIKLEAENEAMEQEFETQYGIEITADVTNFKSQMEKIEEQIRDLDKQQIDIAIKWDGIDEVENAYKNIGKFASVMQKDAEKVGNSYQLTAAQAREWMEVYPDLFSQAKVNSQGIMELDQTVVDNYIEGQEAQVDTTAQSKIEQLKAERKAMEVKLEMAEADLEAAAANAQGKQQLENVSAEYLADMRKKLVKYYMDLGVDEQEANANALKTMGLNEQEYTDLVAKASAKNAENQNKAAKDGGKSQATVLSKLAEKWKSFTTILKRVASAVKAALTGKDVKEAWGSIDTDVSVDTSDYEGISTDEFKFDKLSQDEIDAVREKANDELKATLEANKANIQKAIGSIDSQITYLESLQNQDLSDYGSKSVDDVKGGKGKANDKDTIKLDDELERYHEINEVISDLEKEMDRLSDAKERAYGDNKIKLLNKEIKLLDEQIAANQELERQMKSNLKLDQDKLSKYGASFDEQGRITNYDELYKQEVDKYNAAITAYNLGALTDDQLDIAKENFDNFKDEIAQYEETLNDLEDVTEDTAEKTREKLDKQLEGIQYIVDVQIEVNDRDLKVLERLLDRLEDDLYDGTERIANMTKQIDEQFDNIEIYKAGIRQTLVSAGAGQSAVDAYMAGDSTAVQGLDLTDEQMQMLQDYTDGIMESEDAILELREEIENQTMATFDAWHEKIEKNGQAFEHATTMAESYKNIIDLVGKTRLKLDNSILKDLEETQMNAMTESMRNTKAQMDTTQNALNKAKEELEKARQRGNQEDIEKWEQDIETLNETLMADQEAFMSSWETALQTAADIFTTQMDRAFENLEDDLAGIFKSFDEFNAAMDKQQQVTDRFMDAGKKQYELSKLNRKLQQDLDKTDNTKAQKELLKLQKEIESYQESGVEMSERDLTALQKKYELKLAEIALQDAQNAKSQVRLTRDSEGNFGYVYTADESKVADAQQNYEDKLEENRQLAIEQNQQLSEAIVNNRQAMVEALREIRQEDYADTEAYMQALQETTQFYKDQEAYLISEAQKVIERSQEVYENDYLAYDGWNLQKLNSANNYNTILSDTQLQAYEQMGINTDGWVTQETETMQQLGINILDRIMNGDGASGINGIMEALGSAEDGSGFFGASRIAAEAWASSYAEIMGQAGITIDNYGNEVATVLGPDGTQKSFSDFSSAVQYALYGEGTKTKPADGSVNGAVEAAKAKTVEYATTAQEKFGAIANSVTTWQSTYSGKIKTATQDTNNLNTAIKNLLGEKIELITNIKEVQSDINKLKATIEGLGDKTINIKTKYTTEGTPSSSGSNGNSISDNSDKIEGVAAAIWMDGGSTSGWYVGSDRSSRLNAKGVAAAQAYINAHGPNGDIHKAWNSKRDQLKKYYYGSFDTGGYTGEWGPEGRLAILHQKEIVLNASDTENLLTAVQMIREISGQLEANAMTMKYIKTLENYGAKVDIGGQTLQQDVTIHAEFPNATNHSEIEEAFRNLTNLASQYTNRKN